MTEPDRYGEEIRRALSAAADLVVPAGDGLDIIRKRAARRPPVLAWLLAYVSYLPRQLATQVRVMASELAVMAKGESDLLPRLWGGLRSRAGRARSARAWLLPALAGATALLLVVAVAFAVPDLRQTITNQANNGPGGPGGAGSTGQLQGIGHQSSGASGSSTTGFQSSSGLPPPMMTAGPMPRGPLYLLLPRPGGGTVPNPCVTTTPDYSPTGSPGTASGGTAGAPNDPQGSGYTRDGAPNCVPTTTPPVTTPPVTTPPVTTPPVTTPPVTTPPTTTPPVTTPPTTTPPVTTPPSSTSAAPTNGSTASTPASIPTVSGS
jgi:hypothetical protein